MSQYAHTEITSSFLTSRSLFDQRLAKGEKCDQTEREIRKMLAKGTGKLKIARTFGVSTVQRVAAA